MNAEGDKYIPLKAVVDPDVNKMHWFIENQYIGSAGKDETLLWEGEPGDYQVRVVDDSGRSASKHFSVIRHH